jgi:hypothetical protein|tara:strand:- start:1041 stop:1271 length:231 start_codon:yes stop_codon:yes gene_type:complete
MIIDLILNRKDDTKMKYSPKRFYNEIMKYSPEIAEPIATALDAGTEQQVKKELSNYILEQNYNHNIIKYINSVEWL